MMSQINRMHEEDKRFIAASTTPTETREGYASKILALQGILQTTLEINELIALYSSELNQLLEFDGITYLFPSLNIEIRLGLNAPELSSISYSLIVTEQNLGELTITRTEPFDNFEMELFENLLSALLYPLRNALLYKEAVNSASIDPLTGVHNRFSMETTLKRELRLSLRHHLPLSILLLDIDHFKKINDRYGHLHGDQVLKSVAQSAKQTIRDSDVIFRYGGEEFLIILSNTTHDGACLLAERIRAGIESQNPSGKKSSVTVSIGVTSFNENDMIPDLIERADKALYKAKKDGRNQVVCL